MALSRLHTSTKAANVTELLLLIKCRVTHIVQCRVWRCPCLTTILMLLHSLANSKQLCNLADFHDQKCFWNFCAGMINQQGLPRWLSGLRHSAHRPERSAGGGRGSIPGSAGRFRVRISGAHALRLISRAGKEGSTVFSIICDCWLILS